MTGKIFTSALFAGCLAGLAAAILQLAFVQPVLLHAELYESGKLVHSGAEAVSASQESFGLSPVRDGLSVLFTLLVYTGYALMLVALMALASGRGHTVTAHSGLLWGLAGFIAVQLAPAFGMPPELPGMAGADLGARQVWWAATVLASAAGLGLLAFGHGWSARLGGAVLLLAPHVVGAPQPEAFTGPVPPELGALFAARALGVGMAGWALLGLCCGWFWQRETEGYGKPLRQPA